MLGAADLEAPLYVAWQITNECNLACLHCIEESGPGKAFKDELNREETFRILDQLIKAQVPYLSFSGGEPMLHPHFWEMVESITASGAQLKIETNGQSFTPGLAARLAPLPIRSLQVSLDGDTQAVYAAQRPGASLEKAWAACRLAVRSTLPLEVTFAPTRLNVHEAEAVIRRAEELGAFRFNTGFPMRLGTAAKLWDRLSLSPMSRPRPSPPCSSVKRRR